MFAYARGTFWLYGRSSYVNQTRYEFRLQNYLDGSIDYFLEKLVKVGEVWYGYTLADAMNHHFDIASWHEVKMVLAGGNIKCYIDDTKIFDYTDIEGDGDGDPLLSGGIGLDSMNGGYSCDDVWSWSSKIWPDHGDEIRAVRVPNRNELTPRPPLFGRREGAPPGGRVYSGSAIYKLISTFPL